MNSDLLSICTDDACLNVQSNTPKVRHQLDQIKQNDPGFSYIRKRVFNPDMGKHIYEYYCFYASGSIGSHIRDAECGSYSIHIVGSADEDLYFKVADVSGNLKSRNGSNTLFYLSPDHYERHTGQRVSNAVREKWNAKMSARLSRTK